MEKMKIKNRERENVKDGETEQRREYEKEKYVRDRKEGIEELGVRQRAKEY